MDLVGADGQVIDTGTQRRHAVEALEAAVDEHAAALGTAMDTQAKVSEAVDRARRSGLGWEVIALALGAVPVRVVLPFDDATQHAHRHLPRMTERELEVLGYLATYLPYDRISASMFISMNTLKTHVRTIYRKLGVNSRDAAVEVARSASLTASGVARSA